MSRRLLAAIAAVLIATAGLVAVIAGGDGPPAPPTATPSPHRAPAPSAEFAHSLRGNDPEPIGSGAPPGGRLAPWPGCGRHPVPSFSARTAPVRGIALHITVSRNRPGRDDMNSLTAYASNPANGVSWHFLIDNEGHCYYSVPITAKAWTIAALNSQTVNLEIISFGDEGGWYAGGGAGFAKVRRVVRRIAQLEHIPLRHGATDGHCNITRAGIIAHWEGGLCAGGHNDIHPWNIVRVVHRIAR
jgi:hypothetical protein